MQNKLINETSPYLLQHAYNPVMWYPWGEEAFTKAVTENKPIFLSIGYSTCHWCHVMERESFVDQDVANLLNSHYISIKVDKEERPDIDTIYMTVCQAMTHSGGWPLTIIMTPEKKPFFAATYIPKHTRYGIKGLIELLTEVNEIWLTKATDFTAYANQLTAMLKTNSNSDTPVHTTDEAISSRAFRQLKSTFDPQYGGFGQAPKFPMPHNLLFLLKYHEVTNDSAARQMVDTTLNSMYQGGIFDHIGFGFSRYSTDERWEIPHFEKMLYDNALLIYTYSYAASLTDNSLYQSIAEQTISYVIAELTDPQGGFYCAQDADSEGVEGRFYAFTNNEIEALFNSSAAEELLHYFHFTEAGNFEGKNIPTLLHTKEHSTKINHLLPKLAQYRKQRYQLHRDDKILTSWNGLMIAALCKAAIALEHPDYLIYAERAVAFIKNNLIDGQVLFNSFRDGKRSSQAFIDDYAFFIWGLIELYQTTFSQDILTLAKQLMETAIEEFWDKENDGFYLYGKNSEQFFIRPKETYDGAIPAGNSVMTYNLFFLTRLINTTNYEPYLDRQIQFMKRNAKNYPHGNCFFLYSLLLSEYPPAEITCVIKDKGELNEIKKLLAGNAIVKILEAETDTYTRINDKTTYYVCQNNSCLPPVNDLTAIKY